MLNWWAGTKIVEMVGGTKIVEKVGGHKQLSSLRGKKEIETKFKKINYTLICFVHYLSSLKVVTISSKGDDWVFLIPLITSSL